VSRRLLKKVQMQGGEEARSETYLDVRCNDERPHSPFERGLRPRKLWGRFRKGGVPPSEESQRRRWTFFSSLLGWRRRSRTASATIILGAKGAGEAGTVGALPAVMNAVMDALASLGVRHLDMPATPERVWYAIQDARTIA